MQKRRNRIPKNTICIVITDDNFQKKRIKKGTICKIVTPFNCQNENEYSVEFLPYKKYEELNEKGPFLKLTDVVPVTKAAKVLYGKS